MHLWCTIQRYTTKKEEREMSEENQNQCPKILAPIQFKDWIKTLDAKTIQSWKTEDWMQMYERVEYCIQNSVYYKGEIWSKYNEKLKKKQITPEEFHQKCEKIDNIQFLRKEFVSECEEEFIKLYKNYRMEPEQYSSAIRKGKKIGAQLASIGDIDCSAIAFNINARMEAMGEINIVMLENAYDINRPDYFEQMLAKTTEIDELSSSSSLSGIELSKKIYDSSLRTMTHEGTHYYFQTAAIWMLDLLKQGTTAKDISKDFANLLEKSGQYYLTTKSQKDLSKMGMKEKLEYQEKMFEGYHKQPVEKHANLMGYIIEHTYRGQVNQYSERNSTKLYYHIKSILGMPHKTIHNGKSVTFEHLISPRLDIEKVRKCFQDMPTEILEEMNIRENKGRIAYDIPENWSASKKIEDFIKQKEREDKTELIILQALNKQRQESNK